MSDTLLEKLLIFFPASPILRHNTQGTPLVHGLLTCTYYLRVFKTHKRAH